jgi:hypothetical protein
MTFMMVWMGGARAQAEDLTSQDEPAHWRLVASPYTRHFRPSPEHHPVHVLGLERQLDRRMLLGAAYFRNSFAQPSAYVYVGQRLEGGLGLPQLYLQWSAGVLYGYKGAYKNKVPLNVDGFAPGAVLSVGWQLTPDYSVALHALGDAGVMLQFALELH